MARIAASPRLTMASRWNGRATALTRVQPFPPAPVGGALPLGSPRSVPFIPADWRVRHYRLTRRGIMARMPDAVFTANELSLHGHRVSYRTGGSGPALLLLHGITNSSETWEHVAPRLAERFTVIAPDLLGHGRSATPRGDYSLGAHASGARDVLTSLGIERATVVGHSLGGGIAMQFAYQFPERCERLVLVASGGLGREVHVLLRAAALPGADYVLPLLTHTRLLDVGRGVGGLLRRARIAPSGDLDVLARGFASLDNEGSRQAFLHTV